MRRRRKQSTQYTQAPGFLLDSNELRDVHLLCTLVLRAPPSRIAHAKVLESYTGHLAMSTAIDEGERAMR